jgi:hypothetical protein
MQSDELGLDTVPDLGATSAGVGLQGLAGDDDGGFADNYGFEDAGDNSWSALEKQDDSSISNAPTSAPPTARDGRDPQGMTFCTTDGDWAKSESPKRIVGKPQHIAQWEANTHDHLNHAKMLIQKASVHHQENDRHIHSSHKRGKSQSGAVHTMIKKKMSITNDLIKALEDRHESVEDTIRQVGECLFQLQRAHRSKWAPLNVCERRLELRDTRPLQELVRDHTQEALEHERQTLIESRQELSDQVASCKAALIDLDKLKMDVIEDLSHKRHGLRIDRTCLNPTKPVGASQQDRIVLPALGEVANYAMPPSPKDSVAGSGPQHEESRQLDTKSLLQKAVRMEEEAMKLCNESDAIMLQTKRECQRASTQAQTSIARRADETDDLKRKLEAQMREIDEAIAQTEMSMGRTKKKLENQEMPLKALDTQFSLRGGRTAPEGIRDVVQEEMEGHLETVKKNVKILTAKFQNTKSLLENLKESRAQLTEDYRNKLLALKIEDACLKVTPRKAMELDRMDPRGGRCKVASAKRAVKKEGGPYSLVSTMSLDAKQDQVSPSNADF